MTRDRSAAIIPSFNDAKRIGEVLKQVVRQDIIDAIISLDDGSMDDPESVTKRFEQAKYLLNHNHIGKAGSITEVVDATDADIIFFCDEDMIGMNEEIC